MTHQIVLDIPEDTFRHLERRSQQAGVSPESFAADCVAAAVRPRGPSPALLATAGMIQSDVPDLCERLDDYLGEAYLRTNDPEADR